MTSVKRGSRAKPAREREQDDGAHSGWQELQERLRKIVAELDRSGIVDPIDRLEQVAQLIYLKRLDEEEPAKGSPIFSGMTARFRWSRLRELPPLERYRFVKDHVLSYLGSLVNEAPAVADYFRDATLKIEDPGAFQSIVELIDGIDFRRLEPDEMGRILEFLFAEAKYSGEFRTPRHVRALMVSLVDPAVGETIYDPACGTGGFLTDAVSYVLAKASSDPDERPIYGDDWPIEKGGPPLQTWKVEGGTLGIDRSHVGQLIHGNDISRKMIRIASMNLALQKIGPVNVRRVNSLSNFGGLTPVEMERKYDVILCAPAFGNDDSYDAIRTDLPIPSTRLELLFLEIAMESLAPGGRCAIIVPENVLFSEGSTFVEVRKRLFSTCDVLAVISLPTAVFRPYSAVKTSIFVLRRPVNEAPRSAHVWFYEVEHDGYDLDRTPQPEANDIPELLTRWASFVASDYTRPPGPEAATMRRPEEPSPCWWARRATIEENRFDLSAHRYKPRFADVASRPIEEQLARLGEVRESFVRGVDTLRASIARNVLSHGWSENVPHAKLGNLVDDVQGTTPSINEPSYWGEGFPWVSIKDVNQHRIFDAQSHVTQLAVDQVPLRIIKSGSVLIAVRGMTLTQRIPMALTEVPLVISQNLRSLQPKADSGIDSWYLLAYLKSVEDLLLAYTFGTSRGIRSLPRRFLLDLDVPVPPPEVCAEIGRAMQAYVTLADITNQIQQGIGELLPTMLHTTFSR